MKKNPTVLFALAAASVLLGGAALFVVLGAFFSGKDAPVFMLAIPVILLGVLLAGAGLGVSLIRFRSLGGTEWKVVLVLGSLLPIIIGVIGWCVLAMTRMQLGTSVLSAGFFGGFAVSAWAATTITRDVRKRMLLVAGASAALALQYALIAPVARRFFF